MELERKDTNMIQGLSVLAMVWLHLFDRTDYAGLFFPLIFWKGYPLSFYIAQLSDFCVMGFAFCSGYAHMKLFDNANFYKSRLKSLLLLLCNYWLVMVTFSVVSIIAGNGGSMPGSIEKFILNALLLDNSYNGAWWYMSTYAVLVLISPIVLKYSKKWNSSIVLVGGFCIYFIAYLVRFKMPSGCLGVVGAKFGPFGMTFFEYLLGVICCKTSFLTKIYEIWNKPKKIIRCIIVGVVLIGMLYGHTQIVPSLFIAPFTGLVIIVLFHFWNKPRQVVSLFEFVGNHSTNIWLIHMFFYSYIFKNFVYIARFPVLIFLLMLCITIVCSACLKHLQKQMFRKLVYI